MRFVHAGTLHMRRASWRRPVSSTGFGQRSFISQTSFRLCDNVDVVSAELSGNEALFILLDNEDTDRPARHKADQYPRCPEEYERSRLQIGKACGQMCKIFDRRKELPNGRGYAFGK